jgi:hypothetical protein
LKLQDLVAKNSEAQTGGPVTCTYIFPYRISDYVQYRYVKEWYFRGIRQPLFRALERRFGWHLRRLSSITMTSRNGSSGDSDRRATHRSFGTTTSAGRIWTNKF